jgi:hypothetical protein
MIRCITHPTGGIDSRLGHVLRLSSAAVACFVVIAACQRGRPLRDPATAAAESVVVRYLTADTAGDPQAASALVTSSRDDTLARCNLAYDGIDIVQTTALRRVWTAGDTVFFVLEYSVLGEGTSSDPRFVGPKYWRFARHIEIERETLRVARPQRSPPRIVCDPSHPPNHRGLSFWGTKIPLLDDSSMVEWKSAVRDSRSTQ